MRRFRILAGKHIVDGPKKKNANGVEERTDVVFRARRAGDPPDYDGDIIETDMNLTAYPFNTSKSRKFEELVGGTSSEMDELQRLRAESAQLRVMLAQAQGQVGSPPQSSTPAQPQSQGGGTATATKVDIAALERMSVRELQTYAAEEEIDLRNSTDKREILRILRGSK